jgi:hypothetical protein
MVVEVNMVLFQDVCVYAALDPPRIKKSTITKYLLSELRTLQLESLACGYAEIRVQSIRVAGSSSAKVGKIVDIRRRARNEEIRIGARARKVKVAEC